MIYFFQESVGKPTTGNSDNFYKENKNKINIGFNLSYDLMLFLIFNYLYTKTDQI